MLNIVFLYFFSQKEHCLGCRGILAFGMKMTRFQLEVSKIGTNELASKQSGRWTASRCPIFLGFGFALCYHIEISILRGGDEQLRWIRAVKLRRRDKPQSQLRYWLSPFLAN